MQPKNNCSNWSLHSDIFTMVPQSSKKHCCSSLWAVTSQRWRVQEGLLVLYILLQVIFVSISSWICWSKIDHMSVLFDRCRRRHECGEVRTLPNGKQQALLGTGRATWAHVHVDVAGSVCQSFRDFRRTVQFLNLQAHICIVRRTTAARYLY